MATLAELHTLRHESDMINKVASACAIKAVNIMAEASPTTTRLQWAEECLADADVKARDLFWYLLGNNAASSLATITGADDSTIQTNVDAAVDVLRP